MTRRPSSSPSIETITAIAILTATYCIRIVTLASASIVTPWYLGLSTDLLLPAMAGSWLFIVAMAALIYKYDHHN